jgi:glutaconyl-CoA/methylmalonyl-CoA decarboxylase subunit gamma
MDKAYVVEIDGAEWLVRVSEGPEGLRVRVGDEPERPVDWSLAEPSGLYSLIIDGASHEARAQPLSEEPGAWDVQVRQRRWTARVQTERERRLRQLAGGKQAHTGAFTVKAPMPGLVRAVAVAVGDVVALGQRLLVLEAMKMENDIQAGQAGTVTAVHVAAGDTVQTGRPLVEIE